MTLIDKAEALLPCPFCGEVPEIKERGESIALFVCSAAPCKGSSMFMGFVREDREKAIASWNRRAALPARGEHGVDAVLDAAHDYLMEQYGHSPLKHPTDRARILAALAPTDAAHVNETPKSEHDADNVLTDAAQAPAEDAHAKGETDGQVLERLGMDGAKWAAEFRTTALRLGYSDMDEGWLIGWFCNAIMAGYDRAPTDAAHVNETPKSEHDGADVLTDAQARPAWLSNCVVCGRIVDTREKDEGGDGHGCEYAEGWTCSSDCAERLHPDPDWIKEGLAAQAREAALWEAAGVILNDFDALLKVAGKAVEAHNSGLSLTEGVRRGLRALIGEDRT